MIQVEHLSKEYGGNPALVDVSFTVSDGKIYGLLGPNGAGKTTTMNIMTGCLAPTSGSVSIDGHDIFDEPVAAKRLLGYLPEQPPLYQDMTPQEFLLFVAKLRNVPRGERKAQIDRVIAVTKIDDMRHRLIKNLSKGYKQRVGIAQALLGDPKVIILDEPTVGLDPKQIIEIRDLIRELGERHTVILSSHILSEVQAVCDHILIINKGRLVASDTPENLEKLFAGVSTLKLTVRAPREAIEEALSGVPRIAGTQIGGGENGELLVTLTADGDADLREDLFRAFSQKGLPILGMTTARASLEDIFLEFTENDAAEAAERKEA